MATRVHYRKSPITEAIIDIRVELPTEFKVESLETIQDQIRADYPKREEIIQVQGQFAMAVDAVPSTTRTKQGYLYRSNDGKYILQTRNNGFTLSRLAPYEDWDTFRTEAKRLWAIYVEIARPVRAIRVAVRTINRIDLPPRQELSDYFKTFPEISAELPQILNGYVMQVMIPQEDFGGMLSLIQATVPAPRPDVASINLDIDLYKESSSEFDSDGKIWQLLEHIRVRKNQTFEGCITDKARNLFQPVME